MRILLFFGLCLVLSSSECGYYEDIGFSNEPQFEIFFEKSEKFATYSASENQPKKASKWYQYPGVDMNSNETRFWIYHDYKIDSFTLRYVLSTFYTGDHHFIKFDSIYIQESSILNARIEYDPNYLNSGISNNYIPVFYIPK